MATYAWQGVSSLCNAMCLMLGHAHLHSACQLEGGLLPRALGCRHLSLLSKVAVSAACWLKGISLVHCRSAAASHHLVVGDPGFRAA